MVSLAAELAGRSQGRRARPGLQARYGRYPRLTGHGSDRDGRRLWRRGHRLRPGGDQKGLRGGAGLAVADSLIEAARGADLLVLLTDWSEFSAADPEALGGVMAHRAVAAGRHALDAGRWRAAGWLYGALAAPPSQVTEATARAWR
jgi:hypothetical protein